ncbi:MAG: YMGG-like glycine zipper-containing protein [Acidithiobacillus sp.]|nr:YMGG-like glycine zipper-containing protein [Acidithiobacillus sp.]
MNKATIYKTALAVTVAAALSGCTNNPYMGNGQTADAAGGALLGALAGAVIGNQTGAGLAGAAIGAGVGGLAGYGVGNPPQPHPQQGYYAPPANNPQCPPGYSCVPTSPQYQQPYN